MKPIRFLSTILVFLLFSSYSYASYLDDWPDDALCGWMQNPSPPEHILKEVEKRRLKCIDGIAVGIDTCLLYTSPSPRDRQKSRMPSSA